ncbi:MAG: hypothetical protein WC815_07860 [Vicinamibacterales bacterium]|jgi:glycosyltransferase involved in cell wall biosynthesis
MARISIFIDHDIVIRHFLATGILQTLQASHEVTFVVPEGHRRVRSDVTSLGLKKVRLFKVDERRAYLWRRLYQHEVLRRARRGDAENQAQIYGFWKETLRPRAFWQTWLMSLPGLYSIYRHYALRNIGNSSTFEQLMSELAPDVIVHPTVLEGLFVSDLIRWGREHSVPTIFLMNSWDNPAVKAMTCGQPDWLVVWGEQTRRLAHRHLGMPLDRIMPYGAAQFDLYRDRPQSSRSEVCRGCGISEDKKLVLYAGSSKGVKEVQHLIALEQAIERGDLPECHILFRPHPWRGVISGESDFFAQTWKHTTMDPEMADYYRSSRVNSTIIYTPDTEYTHSILSACDLLISPISTILLEAVMHSKPVIAYLPEEDIDRNFFLRTMANMSFMQEFFDRTRCGPVRTMPDLIAATRECLLDPAGGERASVAQAAAAYFVQSTPDGYASAVDGLVRHALGERTRNSGSPEQET